jgi:hypothetical protein
MNRGWIAPIPSLALALCFSIGAAAPGAVATARANATEWSFEVLEVLRVDRFKHLIRLRPNPPGEKFPRSCETFVIHSFYDLEDWSSAGQKLASRTSHERSVQLLLQAQALHTIVRIASVGRGFGATAEGPRCEVTSRALTVAPDPGGTPVIFSLYEDPRAKP